MKKVYSKPMISVELLSLDQPIALNCIADKDDVKSLMELGYYTTEMNCNIKDVDVEWGNDTICYHSNVQTAFLS